MDNIKSIIPDVIEKLSFRQAEASQKIPRIWSSIIPREAVSHTAIAGFKEGELVVHADSPARVFRLNAQRRTILKALQEEIPEIQKIKFRIGKIK